MAVSFSFIANKVDAAPGQQDWRLLELAALSGVPRGQDPTGGRLGAAAKGLEPLRNPSINKAGTVFLLDHTMEVELIDSANFFCYNTVMFEGVGYMCVSRCGNNKYTGVSITPIKLDLNKLSQKAVPHTMNLTTSGAQRSFSAQQVSGNGEFYSGDGLYNTDGPDDGLYNNDGPGDGLYNNDGPEDGLYNNVVSPATAQKNRSILKPSGFISRIKKSVRFG